MVCEVFNTSNKPLMQTSWVTGLIVICEKSEYKVVHLSRSLFEKCFRKISKEQEGFAHFLQN